VKIIEESPHNSTIFDADYHRGIAWLPKKETFEKLSYAETVQAGMGNITL
jgi:hypothetical protein